MVIETKERYVIINQGIDHEGFNEREEESGMVEGRKKGEGRLRLKRERVCLCCCGRRRKERNAVVVVVGGCVEVQSRGRGMLAMGFWAVFMPRPMFFMLKTSCGKRTFRQQVPNWLVATRLKQLARGYHCGFFFFFFSLLDMNTNTFFYVGYK